MNRKALGRGLDALIRGADEDQGDSELQVRQIPLAKIIPNPRQPRQSFDPVRLEELSCSIREKGVLEPVLVRPLDGSGYELVAGERRLKAAQLAGLKHVPAIVREYDERQSLEIALVENVQREDINPVDEARAYQRLVDEFGRTHAEVSEQVGKDRSTVTNLLRLLRLPADVLDDVSRGTLSAGHARVLLSLETPEEQRSLARRIIEEAWSVREAERAVSSVERQKKPKAAAEARPDPPRDRQVVRVEEALRYALGTEVRLFHGRSGGRIEVRYGSVEELERILDLLNVQVH